MIVLLPISIKRQDKDMETVCLLPTISKFNTSSEYNKTIEPYHLDWRPKQSRLSVYRRSLIETTLNSLPQLRLEIEGRTRAEVRRN